MFLPAGRLDWGGAWIFLLLFLAFLLMVAIWGTLRMPALMEQRSRVGGNVKTWDKVIMSLYAILFFGTFIVAALDAGRFRWSQVPPAIQLVGIIGLFCGGALAWWVMMSNAYASRYVRIQDDRGQQVVTTGPYRYVRHPLYAGVPLLFWCLPLVLESYWALVPGFQRETSAIDLDVTVARRVPAESARATTPVLGPLVSLYPLPFVLVGLAVLSLRPHGRDAWLLALLFAGFGVGPLLQEPVIHPALRGFAAAFNILMSGLFPALFYFFTAVFPARSLLDRRVPWLKWLLLGLAVPVWATAAALVLVGGSTWAAWPFVAEVGSTLFERVQTGYYFVAGARDVGSPAER